MKIFSCNYEEKNSNPDIITNFKKSNQTPILWTVIKFYFSEFYFPDIAIYFLNLFNKIINKILSIVKGQKQEFYNINKKKVKKYNNT